ncbi:Primosomal protein N' (replication factor Y) [Legionella maceachernii]|uniref:Replication restart protein PriA n=1 Tax=Legionella maceachernii TaxID=466 RepID=A0A0W0W1Q2_9GAMM|nr:primosomal protein N' [Legionella maceachernii]KTD26234.1 Primosomal protein N' (replication factor Y) [Legionella maceachernii]SKA10224.1 replication restart DNA helicase PriA [Legionella maceachernii]SUO99519.1 Primosomal protein N' [Legionella maceachernii]
MATQLKTCYQICIPHTNRDYFDYLADDRQPCIGSRVWVPFRNTTRLGLVIGSNTLEKETSGLKSITSVIDEDPLLNDDLLHLCQWVSSYYQSPLSEVIPLALPKKYRLGKNKELPTCDYYQLIVPGDSAQSCLSAKARKQRALVDFLSQQKDPVGKSVLLKEGFTQTQIDALLALHLISVTQKFALPTPPNPITDHPLLLNEEQTAALNKLTEHLNRYHCFLLQGVTGSGKTEVYLQLIAKVLEQGQQVLVLVPEIGLTPQLLARFSARFDQPMAVIHSNLNETERQVAWQLAQDNIIQLVIGTRTAVFTPMPSLGLIIIDEEHDASLKQMEGVRYSARDTALMRAYSTNIPIILGSATPSLESLYNCVLNKYTLLRLNQRALATSPLRFQLLDIRNTPLQQGLAPGSLTLISEHLSQGNQVLVFINRRGFAPVLLCHQCGWMADCHACDSHLTLHRQLGRLICHHCGVTKKIPTHCSACNSSELLPIGAGTQRIHEFLQTQFPHTNLLRIDRDEVRKKNELNTQLERINKGEAQLIVGTQMLAKGHHFPRLTLVVVLDTDAGFYNQDFRALERLGQLVTQVSGRAGRAQYAGQVVIQTHIPQHPLLNLLVQQGYDAFAKALLAMRQHAELPPYHYLAVIRAQDKAPSKVLQFLHTTKEQLEAAGIRVLGPAPAPLARKAKQHRMQLLIKSSSRKILHHALTKLRAWLTMNKLSNMVRWNVDIDPMDLS